MNARRARDAKQVGTALRAKPVTHLPCPLE
jgi:hypothetical protein